MSPQPDALQSLSADAERIAAATAEIEAAGFRVVPADEIVPPELREYAQNISFSLIALVCLIHRGKQDTSYEAAVSISKQMAKFKKRMAGIKDPTGKNYEYTTEVWEIREKAYWDGFYTGSGRKGWGIPSC